MAGDLTARIPTRPETRDMIAALKEDGERYDDVLRRLHAEHTEETANA